MEKEQVKKTAEKQNPSLRPIVRKDIFLIFSLCAFLIFAFLVPLFFVGGAAGGVSVTVNGEEWAVVNFDLSYSVAEDKKQSASVEKTQDYVILTLFFDGGGRSEIKLSADKSVCVISTDCPKKDCAHMKIEDGAGVIVCLPFGLKITPTAGGDIPLTVGEIRDGGEEDI